jgi:hypothetical protein
MDIAGKVCTCYILCSKHAILRNIYACTAAALTHRLCVVKFRCVLFIAVIGSVRITTEDFAT